MIALLCGWVGFFAAYLVFAGQVSADEVVAAALCAGAAALWWAAVRHTSAHAFAFDWSALAAAGRACRKLPWATISVAGFLLRALVRREAGEVDRWFYAPGRSASPADSARRAVGILAASLAPDSFVLRAQLEHDQIVMHGFARGEPLKDPRWPI